MSSTVTKFDKWFAGGSNATPSTLCCTFSTVSKFANVDFGVPEIDQWFAGGTKADFCVPDFDQWFAGGTNAAKRFDFSALTRREK